MLLILLTLYMLIGVILTIKHFQEAKIDHWSDVPMIVFGWGFCLLIHWAINFLFWIAKKKYGGKI